MAARSRLLRRLDHSVHVDVWVIEVGVGGPRDVGAALAFLSPSERAAAARLRHAEDRHRSVTARAALRRLVASRIDVDPGEVQLGRDDLGRPVILGGAGDRASIAHSGGFVACATASRQVGVDIEPGIRPEADDDFAARVCTLAERRTLGQLSAQDRMSSLMRLWVRKEALAKALGEGLRISFDELDVSRDTPVRAGVRQARWRVRDLSAPHGYVAAVAARGSLWRVRARLISSD